jgi:hypothetical protein
MQAGSASPAESSEPAAPPVERRVYTPADAAAKLRARRAVVGRVEQPIVHRDTKPDSAVPVRLDVVPVAELADPAQRFQCAPLRCKMRARDCVARQRQHGARVGTWVDPQGRAHRRRDEGGLAGQAASGVWRASTCVDCELGRAVASRLGNSGAQPPPEPAQARRPCRDGAPQAVGQKGDGAAHDVAPDARGRAAAADGEG